jgi:hypothetical protein
MTIMDLAIFFSSAFKLKKDELLTFVVQYEDGNDFPILYPIY